MSFLRTATSAVLGFICMLAVAALVTLVTLSFTLLNPATVKRWLAASGVYSGLFSIVNVQVPTSDGTNVVNADALKKALGSTFTPSYLQQQTEGIIDANYNWLYGKTSGISYSVPVNNLQNAFEQNLASAITPALSSLPTCTAVAASSGCVPKGMTAAQYAQQLSQQTVDASNFLDQPLTQKDLGTVQVPGMNNVRFLAQHQALIITVLSVVIVATIVAEFFLGVDHYRTTARLARRIFISTAATLVLGLLAILLGNNLGNIFGSGEAGTTLQLVQPLLHQALPDIGMVMSAISGTLAVISLALWIIMTILRRRKAAAIPQTMPTPVVPPSTPPAPLQ